MTRIREMIKTMVRAITRDSTGGITRIINIKVGLI